MAPLLIGAVVGCLIFYFIRRYNKFTPSWRPSPPFSEVTGSPRSPRWANASATVISTCGISQGLPWASFSTESMFCWWLSFSTVARFVTKENLTACLRGKRMKTNEADNISAYQSGYLTIKIMTKGLKTTHFVFRMKR